MKQEKKEIKLSGSLICPITVGKPAVFAAEGRIYRTSVVIGLHEQTEEDIHFETLNTHYHLSISPFPAAGMRNFPMELAACA